MAKPKWANPVWIELVFTLLFSRDRFLLYRRTMYDLSSGKEYAGYP